MTKNNSRKRKDAKQNERSGEPKKTLQIEGEEPNDTIGTRCSPERVFKMIKGFNESQKSAVKDIGFGGILHLKSSNLNRELCLWLVERVNIVSCSLRIGDKILPISPVDVGQIFGLNVHGDDVETNHKVTTESSQQLKALLDMYFSGSKEISLKQLEKQLFQLDSFGDEFKVKFVLYILVALLCPTMSYGLPHYFILAIKDVNEIANKNWAKFVFDFLVQGLRKYKKKKQHGISGCLFFLELFYLEHISIGGHYMPFVSRTYPRLVDWGDKEINHRIDSLKQLGGFDNTEVVVVSSNETTTVPTTEILNANANVMQRLQNIENYVDIFKCEIASLREDLQSTLREGLQSFQEVMLDAFNKRCTEELKTRKEEEEDVNQNPTFPFSPQAKASHNSPVAGGSYIHRASSPDVNQSPNFPCSSQAQKIFNSHVDGGSYMDEATPPKVASKPVQVPILVDSYTKDDPPTHPGLFRDAISSAPQLPRVIELRNEAERRLGKFCKSPYADFTLPKHKVKHTEPKTSTLDQSILDYVYDKSLDKRELLVNMSTDFGYRMDLQCLLPSVWITDTIINLVGIMLVEQEKQTIPSMRRWFFPTTYAQKILKESKTIINDLTSGLKMQKLYMGKPNCWDKIYIPINDGGSHWYMCILDSQLKVVHLLDPSGTPVKHASREEMVKKVVLVTENFLKWSWKGTLDAKLSEWPIIRPAMLPTQSNGYDCGMYVIHYMKSKQWPIPPITGYASMRNRLAIELFLSEYNLVKKMVFPKIDAYSRTNKRKKRSKKQC